MTIDIPEWPEIYCSDDLLSKVAVIECGKITP